MGNRLELQSILEELLGSRNVYFQPPESLKMQYPCIRYVTSNVTSVKADDSNYLLHKSYEITYISRNPDNDEIIKKILSLPYTDYDRHYVSDNLNHDVFTIYY